MCRFYRHCSVFYRCFVYLYIEPARIDRTTPLPPSSDSEINIGAGRPDEPVEVMDSVTVRLHCPYTGIDEPTTRWVTVNNDRTTTDVVSMPPNVVIVNENNSIILVIMNFSEELEATYRCVTDNNAGSDDGDVVLRCKDYIKLYITGFCPGLFRGVQINIHIIFSNQTTI